MKQIRRVVFQVKLTKAQTFAAAVWWLAMIVFFIGIVLAQR